MPLPYKIATLLYCFNAQDEVLLLQRAQEPNFGLWSPPGGKLQQETGESPHTCAIREAAEELGIALLPRNLHLTGIISERGYADEAHWLMFLFEVNKRLTRTPSDIREGHFRFFARDSLDAIDMPETDREMIWPLFWKHRNGLFVAHCRCQPHEPNEWTVEQSITN